MNTILEVQLRFRLEQRFRRLERHISLEQEAYARARTHEERGRHWLEVYSGIEQLNELHLLGIHLFHFRHETLFHLERLQFCAQYWLKCRWGQVLTHLEREIFRPLLHALPDDLDLD